MVRARNCSLRYRRGAALVSRVGDTPLTLTQLNTPPNLGHPRLFRLLPLVTISLPPTPVLSPSGGEPINNPSLRALSKSTTPLSPRW